MRRDRPTWRVYVDAALSADGGRVGFGMVVRDGEGRVRRWAMGRMQGRMGSHEAEYAALVWALARLAEWAVQGRLPSLLIICTDNEGVVNQIRREAAVRHPRLPDWDQRARAWLQRLPRVRFTWVARADNRVADALARAALEGGPDVGGDQL